MEDINIQKEKYFELEMLNQQLVELENSLMLMEDDYLQMQYAKEALKTMDEKDEILIPLVPGIFLSAKDVDLKKIKVGVGSNILIDKDLNETLKTIEEHVKKIIENKEKTQELFDNVSLRAIKLQEEIEKNH
ncbi:MAG: hypothetical protein AB7V77_05115 [Candidatus Woesearchaeota archaeon]